MIPVFDISRPDGPCQLNQNACLRRRRIRSCSQFYGTQATVYKTVVAADLIIKVASSD